MKQFFLLLCLTINTVIHSQNISVKSFRQLTNDMTARIDAPKKDQNGDVCAIIKVVTIQTGFTWEPDGLGIVSAESKAGEYWLYVPFGAKRITIKHPQLGILRDYMYTLPIEKASVYEMVLTTGKVVTTIEENIIPTQFVLINSIPDTADVYINDNLRGQTPFQSEFTEGDYNYRLVKDLYHPEAGKFNLNSTEGKKEINLTLKPNFGFAEIVSSPESGMSVTIDGVQDEQKTPFKTTRLKSGKHKITVSKSLFHEQSNEVTIIDGLTSKVEFIVKPAFGSIQAESKPENGAVVFLDGKETGLITPCSMERIISGEHTLTFRMAWYEPKTTKVIVTDGKKETIAVDLKPTFGLVKLISDDQSDIYIDDQLKGKGKWEGRLIASVHSFEARKEKHHNATQKINLLIGDNKEIRLDPAPMYGKIKVIAIPAKAIIKLNGKEYGETPVNIPDIFVGEYTLSLEKPGYGTITKSITVEENKTTEINEKLPNGMEVTIRSEPPGAVLTIDGAASGSAPVTTTLGFGDHAIRLVNGKKIIEETINVSQGGKSSFSYNVNENIPVTISSNPKGGRLTVDGISQGITPATISLVIGNHVIRIEDAAKSTEEIIMVSEEARNFSFDLYECNSKISISSRPDGASVYVDGSLV